MFIKPPYQISQKSIHKELHRYMHRMDELTQLIGAYCNYADAPKTD